jgi:hypothetical protein
MCSWSSTSPSSSSASSAAAGGAASSRRRNLLLLNDANYVPREEDEWVPPPPPPPPPTATARPVRDTDETARIFDDGNVASLLTAVAGLGAAGSSASASASSSSSSSSASSSHSAYRRVLLQRTLTDVEAEHSARERGLSPRVRERMLLDAAPIRFTDPATW